MICRASRRVHLERAGAARREIRIVGEHAHAKSVWRARAISVPMRPMPRMARVVVEFDTDEGLAVHLPLFTLASACGCLRAVETQ